MMKHYEAFLADQGANLAGSPAPENPANPEHRFALDDSAYSVWLATFLLFLAWWFLQLLLYVFQARTASNVGPIRLPLAEEDQQQSESTARLNTACKIGRDTFLMLFPAAVFITAVGGTTALASFAWIFFAIALLWQIGSFFVGNSLVHAGFNLVLFALVVSMFITAWKNQGSGGP